MFSDGLFTGLMEGMNERKRRIAVVGAGAVGAYYGAMLAFAGEDVHFLFRSDFEVVSREGLTIRTPDGDRALAPVQAYSTTDEIGPCDLVIVALKATSNSALPELLKPLLKRETILLTLQNGLGNEEFLAGHYGEERVMGALCFICLNRTSPGIVENFFPGYLVVGDFRGTDTARADEVAKMFSRAGLDGRFSDSLTEARWRKLVWNIPFNGLAIAGGGIDTQKILADEGLRRLARALMHETINLAKREHVEIEEEFVQRQFDLTEPMGPYKPSSLIDYLAGREVEVEAIWGEPLRRGKASGLKTPRLEMLYWLLKALTPGRR